MVKFFLISIYIILSGCLGSPDSLNPKSFIDDKLVGDDENQNGIRDDVEAEIKNITKKHNEQSYLLSFAYYAQKMIKNRKNHKTVKELSLKYQEMTYCLLQAIEENTPSGVDLGKAPRYYYTIKKLKGYLEKIERIQYNTRDRTLVEVSLRQHFKIISKPRFDLNKCNDHLHTHNSRSKDEI